MGRPRHTNKHVDAAVSHAESLGWRVLPGRGHWGYLYCPFAAQDGCKVRVDGTPKNPENHAKKLRRAIANCPPRVRPLTGATPGTRE